ncbi:Sec-independent protein translocase TatC [Panacagrimonas perspica]|uniref:Sec-independent protein translocase protein TatC n=2 Tax=Panacagrimonas perspica TaxID=381431 RepID=A0A4R7P2S6_9GAMM|nr:twin-arginine translocase subunit TatC [Panacagrimonas perspica]TDU28043.1 Sec-independent protein translocase TatC [Panacagrimonas perspica]
MSEAEQESTVPEQPLMAHLLELRDRVLKMMYGVGIAFAPLAYFSKQIYAIVAEPLMKLMPPGTSMIATEVASPFFAPLKLSMILAVAVSMPWTLFQLWAFVAPGLYKSERRLVTPLLFSSTVLFYAGMAMAYFLVLPTVFKFLISVAPEGVAVMTDINKYLNFVLAIFLAFGLAFETPVAIVLLIHTGFVTPKQLRENRGYVLVGCFVVAAVMTPPDIVSQFLLAVPTYVLYEIGIIAGQFLTPDIKQVEEQQLAERE